MRRTVKPPTLEHWLRPTENPWKIIILHISFHYEPAVALSQISDSITSQICLNSSTPFCPIQGSVCVGETGSVTTLAWQGPASKITQWRSRAAPPSSGRQEPCLVRYIPGLNYVSDQWGRAELRTIKREWNTSDFNQRNVRQNPTRATFKSSKCHLKKFRGCFHSQSLLGCVRSFCFCK